MSEPPNENAENKIDHIGALIANVTKNIEKYLNDISAILADETFNKTNCASAEMLRALQVKSLTMLDANQINLNNWKETVVTVLRISKKIDFISDTIVSGNLTRSDKFQQSVDQFKQIDFSELSLIQISVIEGSLDRLVAAIDLDLTGGRINHLSEHLAGASYKLPSIVTEY